MRGIPSRISQPPRFYMYPGPHIDQSWLGKCAGFSQLRASPLNERLAEVEMHEALRRHPQRVENANDAQLFYVPIWEVSSWHLGDCNGTSHKQRMLDAARALLAAPSYRARNGRPAGFDHFAVRSQP